MALIRVVDFVDQVNERTANGRVSVKDAVDFVLGVSDWGDLELLRASTIELQQLVEQRMVGFTAAPHDAERCGHCGAVKPIGQSCGCFDNGSQ